MSDEGSAQKPAPERGSGPGTPAGWYPESGFDWLRYWDGTEWTAQRRSAPSSEIVSTSQITELAQATDRFCAACGAQRQNEARFCGHCGEPFGDATMGASDDGARPTVAAHGMTGKSVAPLARSQRRRSLPATDAGLFAAWGIGKLISAALIIIGLVTIPWYIYANQDSQRLKCVGYELAGRTPDFPDVVTCFLNGNLR